MGMDTCRKVGRRDDLLFQICKAGHYLSTMSVFRAENKVEETRVKFSLAREQYRVMKDGI